MQKPFEYNPKPYHFRIHHLEEGLPGEERAKYEILEFIKWEEGRPSPYPSRRDWVFSNLQTMINFRNGKN